MKLFDMFNITTDIFCEDPNEWNTNLNYKKALDIFRNLEVVNDAIERCVKLISDEVQK